MSYQTLTDAIAVFVKQATAIKSEAENALKSCGSTQLFVEKKLGIITGLIRTYGALYSQAKVRDRKTLEKQWARLYRIPEVQEAVDNLLDFEKSFDAFLENIDKDLALGSSQTEPLNSGDPFPGGISVVNARTGSEEEFSHNLHVVELEAAKNDLASQGCRIILVSFGVAEGATQWLNDTKSTFPMYLDRKRKIYSALHLPRSIARSQGSKPYSYYGEAFSKGELIPQFYMDDDADQLGGDFIVSQQDNQVIFSLIHQSTDATDRPKVVDLLEYVQSLNNPEKS